MSFLAYEIISGAVVLLLVTGVLWARHAENKDWNNGACTKCSTGWWKSFDVASDGSVGYKCVNPGCSGVTWQSWHGRGMW